MINLYEYQNKESYEIGDFEIDVDALEAYLDEIWKNRESSTWYGPEVSDEEEQKVESQRFLQILRGSKELKSNKYVGVIKYEGQTINLLPKIFYKEDQDSEPDLHQIQLHLLWWLSYCDRVKFPSFDADMSSIDSDFFDILIYLFSKYTRELLSSAIYQEYQEVNRELVFVKGRIDMNAYINKNLSRGNWHKISCTYDSFEMDNQFNRVIKHVANLLLSNTRNSESHAYLSEILFILDEVTDSPMTARDCASIQFNPMFADFEKVRDYCQLFLDHSIAFDYRNDLRLFAFLIPMERLFEDFVFGFIDREVKGVTMSKKELKLTNNNLFVLKPDGVLTKGEEIIIADTKYKLLNDNMTKKWGVSESDMYQMVTYAIRYNCKKLFLFYPCVDGESQPFNKLLTIRDELAIKDIEVSICQLPIASLDLDQSDDLSGKFRSLSSSLTQKILQYLATGNK